ncbi:MAG: hypothetical protein LCI00_10160 [Chloroflexi bacterium]|nr:hypothetical protein [Chloroflexota bacterium]MCC6892910.1 hypothetical protein [Anaerolineae bacterium]
MMNFFRLIFDVELENRWLPLDIVDEVGEVIPPNSFTKGIPFGLPKIEKLKVVLDPEVIGNPVHFAMTPWQVPIVDSALAKIIEDFEADAIQRIPVTVLPDKENYEILNIVSKLNCLDYDRTTIQYYEEYAPPGKIGKIRSLTNIHLISRSAENHHIFRLADYTLIIVVSEVLKLALEEKRFTGMRFDTL